MPTFEIRDAYFPEERPQLEAFILGLQRFEHAIQPDRRLDDAVASEFFDDLVPRALARNGRILVAAGHERLLGWAVVYEDLDDLYIVAEERRFGYVSELFVDEAARGQGIGRALLDAAETWARGQNLHVMMIGVLSGSERTSRIYRGHGFAPYALQLKKRLGPDRWSGENLG